MTQHYITKCSCGNTIAQCRCPSKDKIETVVERGCERCHGANVSVTITPDDVWKIVDSNDYTVYLSRADWRYVNSIIHEHYHGED